MTRIPRALIKAGKEAPPIEPGAIRTWIVPLELRPFGKVTLTIEGQTAKEVWEVALRFLEWRLGNSFRPSRLLSWKFDRWA